MQASKQTRVLSLIIATVICIAVPIICYIKIGTPPTLILGGSAAIAYVFWYFTYLRNPVEPKIILPLFILTVAGLQVHIIEEYQTSFGPAMSRLFNIAWNEKSFLMIFALIGPTIYTLTTLGLFYKIPLAGFIAWFIFIGPGVAEFSHFIFPLIQPAIEPTNINSITKTINGTEISNMPNYFYKATAHYYFSGMWTVLLPMIPGIFAIYRLIKEHKHELKLVI